MSGETGLQVEGYIAQPASRMKNYVSGWGFEIAPAIKQEHRNNIFPKGILAILSNVPEADATHVFIPENGLETVLLEEVDTSPEELAERLPEAFLIQVTTDLNDSQAVEMLR